jgi:hypothetical protein
MARNKMKGIVKVHPERLRSFLAGGNRAKKRPPHATGQPLAPGFKAQHGFDLKNHGGRTLGSLSFLNVYLGAGQWAASDMTNVDQALAAAMSDRGLNDVVQQYFDGQPISTTFVGAKRSDAAPPATIDRDSVSQTLDQLLAAGQLEGLDFTKTVVNLLLPPGIILDSTGTGAERQGGDADDKDSSKDGLGGYHGSHRAADGTQIYFAAAVYSQELPDGPNGIPVWPDSWKNVVATLYHELNEARTDADVEQVNATGDDGLLGWYSQKGGEIGDIPILLAENDLQLVFVEKTLGTGQVVPVQLLWSNSAGGPGEPF